jgi:hypothetical protein
MYLSQAECKTPFQSNPEPQNLRQRFNTSETAATQNPTATLSSENQPHP